MKKLFLIWMLFYFLLNSFGQTVQNKVPKLSFNKFESYLHRTTDTLYVVNFWASWCVPCREELPAFEKIGDKYSKMKVKVLLVSLDFPNQLETRLLPFIKKYKLKSEVILLDDPNQNQWIDKVDPKWSGALPFTQIYNAKIRESYERSFKYAELDSLINLKLNVP